MKTSKLKLSKLEQDIFRLLCIKSNLILNQRELSEYLDVSESGVKRALENLEENNLIVINKNKRTKIKQVSLNRDNPSVINLKRIENLKMIYESNLMNFLENKFPGATIILFGSFSFGEDIYSSDIDIAIIGSEKVSINLKNFQKILERDINLQFFTSWKKIPRELKNNLLNGILLSGSVDL